MGFTKAKSWTRTTNATMLTHQEATAASHGLEKLGLDTVRLGEGHIPCCEVGSVLDNREVSWDRDAIQSSSKSLLKQVEVLS